MAVRGRIACLLIGVHYMHILSGWLRSYLRKHVVKSLSRPWINEALEARVYLATTPIPFQLNSSYSTGTSPSCVLTADVNGDGKSDAISVLPGSNAISVSLGRGNGTFGSPTLYSVGTDPVWAALGDFNGDGHIDIVTANASSHSISILLGKGDGTFAAPVVNGVTTRDYSLTENPDYVAVGDFNRDGKLDIAVANDGPAATNSPILSVFLGNGNGTFQSRWQSEITNVFWCEASSLAVADFNGDGIPDLAIGNPTSGVAMVALGNGDGTFRFDTFVYPTTYFSNGEIGTAYTVAAADLNGDGNPDLVIVDGDGTVVSSVNVFLGNGSGGFGPEQTYYAGRGPGNVAIADVNGDGYPDLIVTNAGYSGSAGTDSSGGVSVFLNNGDGTFQPSTAFATGAGPVAVVVADINADGNPDLLVADSASNDLSLDLGYGDGTFEAPKDYLVTDTPTQQNTNVTGNPEQIAIADVNGDGVPDIVTADNNDNGSGVNDTPGYVSVLLGQGGGIFDDAVKIPAGDGSRALAVGDFDGDGKKDVAILDVGENAITVFSDWTNGTFLDQATYPIAGMATTIVAADFNGDGKLDLAVALWGSSTVQVLLNNGDGTFGSAQSFTDPGGGANLAAGDFNNDGKVDLVCTSWSSGDLGVMLNNGTVNGVWQGLSAPIITQNAGPAGIAAVAVGDFNGDGKLDVATRTGWIDSDPHEIDVYLGNGTGAL